MGDWLLAQKRKDEAIIEYELAHELDPGTNTMLALFDAMDSSGRRVEAVARLEAWSLAHPQDIEAQRKLALWYLPTRQLDKAKKLHEELLSGTPNDPVLLSNLARLYQLEGDPRAREFAERAVRAKPDWPVALDTLGWILVTEGEITRGLEYLREAISRENNPLTRYHLAQALGEQGRVSEARSELRRLLSSGAQIEWMDDVQRSYDSLAKTAEKPTGTDGL
jgi:predicted Zn-dependent protease